MRCIKNLTPEIQKKRRGKISYFLTFKVLGECDLRLYFLPCLRSKIFKMHLPTWKPLICVTNFFENLKKNNEAIFRFCYFLSSKWLKINLWQIAAHKPALIISLCKRSYFNIVPGFEISNIFYVVQCTCLNDHVILSFFINFVRSAS